MSGETLSFIKVRVKSNRISSLCQQNKPASTYPQALIAARHRYFVCVMSASSACQQALIVAHYRRFVYKLGSDVSDAGTYSCFYP